MKKVLVVDDNLPLHGVLANILKLMGYDSIDASSGKECLSKAAAEKPDLILLDIGLPDMDGREVARQLRSDPASKDIPILAFTAMFDAAIAKSCLDAGCDDFMLKPVSHSILREKLRNLLESTIHAN